MFTRGGGSAITEQIVKNIPIIFREKLIINEKINKKIFTDFGVGLSMNRISDAPKILEFLLKNPLELEEIKKRQKLFVKENFVKNIVDFVLERENSINKAQ